MDDDTISATHRFEVVSDAFEDAVMAAGTLALTPITDLDRAARILRRAVEQINGNLSLTATITPLAENAPEGSGANLSEP